MKATAAFPLAGRTPLRKGEVIDRVELCDHPGQTYALYIRSNYRGGIQFGPLA